MSVRCGDAPRSTEHVNSSSCLGTTSTLSCSFDRSAPGSSKDSAASGLALIDPAGVRVFVGRGKSKRFEALLFLLLLAPARSVVVRSHGEKKSYPSGERIVPDAGGRSEK